MIEWIRESNLIEGIDRPEEDRRSELAWQWFKDQPITVANILKLHKRITWKQLGEHAGQFRKCQVWVGGREGAKWADVPYLVAQWMNTCSAIKPSNVDEGEPMNTLVKGSVAELIKLSHISFEKIHPFIDGNGRTGRMLMNRQRVAAGLEPLLIKSAERQAYYRWFE